MKKIILFITVILFAISCRKNNPDTIFNQDKVQSKVIIKGLRLRTSSSITYRGAYVDSLWFVLGDTAKENNLLRWCQQNNITTLTYYNLSAAMLKASRMAYFLKLARTNYGIKENSAVVGSDTYASTTIDTFNSAKSDTLMRFNWVNLELEWWNNATTWSDYISKLHNIKIWGQSKSPKVQTEEYIGWFLNPSGQDSSMASQLLINSDRILVHDYYSTPSWGYISSRVDYISRAASALGKQANIIPIFSATSTGSATYLANNTFDDTYLNIANDFDNSALPAKSYASMNGYQIFALEDARMLTHLPYQFKVNNASVPISGVIRTYDSNGLLDTQSWSANANTLKTIKETGSWRLELDATNSSPVRYIIEIYINGAYIGAYSVYQGYTRTNMTIPTTGLQGTQGDVYLAIYPG